MSGYTSLGTACTNLNSQHIRERLQRRRAELLRRCQRISRDLSLAGPALCAGWCEQFVAVEDDATLEAILTAALDEIAQIDSSLTRLSVGEYGICRHCGELIGAKRLAAVPHAQSCSLCQP